MQILPIYNEVKEYLNFGLFFLPNISEDRDLNKFINTFSFDQKNKMIFVELFLIISLFFRHSPKITK